MEETRPAVACLQEIKSQDEGFPIAEFEKLGYHGIWHGQKGFNGVAILADGEAPREVRRGLEGEPEDEHSRYLEADVFGVRVVCIYLPNGNPVFHDGEPGPKFAYKLRWMERLRTRMAQIRAEEVPAIVTGDYNVIPTDRDVWSPPGDGKRCADAAAIARCLYPAAGRWLDRCAGAAQSAWRSVDLLGLPGRSLAARPRVSDRSRPALPRTGRPAGRMRGGQGASWPGKRPAITPPVWVRIAA
ncbi:exodeoxyribonuclease III [Novosphingobium colocasiae]